MRRFLLAGATSIVLVAGYLPVPSYAQGTADPRALEACQSESQNFVEISECLPAAHVAIVVLDTFEVISPADAFPLKTRCQELNTRVEAAASCVLDAVEAAISLKASLPPGASLDDPIFNATSNEHLLAELTVAKKEAEETFPAKTVWASGMFYPYRP